MKRRVLSLALVVFMLLSLMPVGAVADGETSGTYTDDNGVTYTLENGTMTVSGAGECDSGWKNYFDRSAVTEVVIKDGVTSIGEWTFYGCRALTSATIPDSINSIGEKAFYYCSSLESITIPDSVTSIGEYAFSACTILESITIPDSVTSIGEHAFSACVALESVSIGNGMTSISLGAFYNCSSLTSITIPDSVTSIAWYAFYKCTSLTSVGISNSVTSIGEWAFSDCSSLTSVAIPDSVTSIGDTAFRGCSSITEINVSPENKEYSSVDGVLYNKWQTELIQCPGGKSGSITIPNSVTSIGYEDFYDCSSLTEINVSPENTDYSSIDGVLYNKEKTELITCPRGKNGSITIPNSVTSIGSYAFSGCSSLTSITIPDSVTSICDAAFDGCSSLTSVSIGNGVTSAGTCLFSRCSSLKSITIPSSVTSINYDTFRYCTALTSVTISDSVTSIRQNAFDDCAALTDVYYGGTQEQWNAISIDYGNDCLTNATIHYNSGQQTTHTHETELKNAKSATCTEAGYTGDEVCKTCGETVKAGTAIAAIGHDYKDGVCTVCGEKDPDYKGPTPEVIPGDINGDGAVNILDLIRLKKFLAGENVELVGSADVNGDGTVNILDLIRLKKFLAGVAVELK